MKLKSLIVASFVLSSSLAHALVDSDGNKYKVTINSNGAVLQSKTKVIYLGNSCGAKSPQLGRGTWGWANGGVIIQFIDHRVAFPRQESPFEDERCPL